MKSLVALLILFLAGCHSPLPDIRIKRTVAKNEVIGTWVLDSNCSAVGQHNTIDRYIPDPAKPHQIILHANGTCQFLSVIENISGPHPYRLLNGTWKLETDKENPSGSRLSLNLGRLWTDYEFREEKGTLILWQYWGDPDSCNFIEYQRAPSPCSLQSPTP